MNYDEFKNNVNVKTMAEMLERKLSSRGFAEVTEEDILDELYSAIQAVNSRRRFVPTSTKLFEEQYIGLIIRLCITSISKWGAEGESAHFENGIDRKYEKGSEYPESMLSEIVPLGRAVK